jgi:hypothetical protein
LKKPLASSDSPPSLTYFIDRDLGRYQFSNALRTAGLRIEQYADHFSDTALDEDWLPLVGERGWIALTHDRRISLNPLQTEVSMRSGVRLFILRGKVSTHLLAQNFLTVEPRVRLMVAKHPAPFIAKVYAVRNETRRSIREAVQMYLTAQEWRSSS